MNGTERSTLKQLAARADIVSAANGASQIVPATRALIDALTAIGADGGDLEADVDDEPNRDGELTAAEPEPPRAAFPPAPKRGLRDGR